MAARTKLWIALLVGLVLAQIGASLLMRRGDGLMIASDLIQGGLLLVATAAYLPNTSRSRCPTLHIWLFWILMSLGMFFWLLYQGMWNYFEVLKRQDVPDPFLGDIVLFLHLVPMIAALAVLPHLHEDERDERVRMLDFTLLLIWWVFIYVYFVIPWQTVWVDERDYNANLNLAYLIEKLLLLAALAVLAYTAHGRVAAALRTVAGRERALRFQFVCRDLGDRPQTLLQRQHLRHPADPFDRMDGRGALAGAAF